MEYFYNKIFVQPNPKFSSFFLTFNVPSYVPLDFIQVKIQTHSNLTSNLNLPAQ